MKKDHRLKVAVSFTAVVTLGCFLAPAVFAATGRGRGGAPDATLEPDDVVRGEDYVKKLMEWPRGCRVDNSATTFLGGFRLWARADDGQRPVRQARPS